MRQIGKAITHKNASNLAFAFVVLHPKRRQSIASLYAFCREVDDIADDVQMPENQRRQRLAECRSDLQIAFSGGDCQMPVNQKLKPIIDRYRLPFALFDELIKGVESDLNTFRYQTDAALRSYCYRVASVVGLLSIEIFGYQNPQCRHYATQLGFALQYTNILRDVKSDAKRGRIYLPLEDLDRFGVKQEEILAGHHSERFVKLAEEIAARTKCFYARADALLPREDRSSMIAAQLMARVYWELLRKLERRRFDVFSGARVRISKPRKLLMLLLTWLHVRLNIGEPPYQLKSKSTSS